MKSEKYRKKKIEKYKIVNSLKWWRTILPLLFTFHFSLFTSASETSDSLIVRQMSEYGIHFTKGNEVKLLMSGKEKFADMFEAIRQAKSSVHLEYFNFRNDSIAGLLFDILREKRKEGVEVRAVFDGFGNDSNNQPLKKTHLKALHEDSIEIYEFDPIRFPWVNHIWPRDHRKIVVIDGEIGYTGGMNVADYYLVGTEQVGEWRDMHCRIEGPAVNELQDIFIRFWEKLTKEKLTDEKYFRGTEAGNKMVGIATREPHTTNKIMRQFYISALDNAKDSVKIVNPYFCPTSSVIKALKRCAERGVKMDIIMSSRYDVPLVPDVVYYNLRKLMKRGAKIWRYRPGFHHSKIMMVDGKYCTVGSTNLDARSLRFDYEINALIIDKDVTRQLDDKFIEDTKKCDLLTEEEYKRSRSTWKRFRGWLGHLLTPWL
ncbi:MAG: cardiolipin synthase [Prevotella sp.]|nr:cardiolipin synthase [Prevotella sp.]MBR2229936.1 cardiolipin synthase [Prevotella sp.]